MTNPTNQAGGVAEPDDERSAKDYAIEHAEYMAVKAERLLDAVQEHAAAHQAREGDGNDLDSDEDISSLNDRCDRADEGVTEAMAKMRDGIHEFRKRRDRAALATKPAAPAEVVAPSDDEQLVATLIHCSREVAPNSLYDYDLAAVLSAAAERIAALRTPAQAPSTGAVATVRSGGLGGKWGRRTWLVCWEEAASQLPDGEHKLYLAPSVVQPASPAVEVASAKPDAWLYTRASGFRYASTDVMTEEALAIMRADGMTIDPLVVATPHPAVDDRSVCVRCPHCGWVIGLERGPFKGEQYQHTLNRKCGGWLEVSHDARCVQTAEELKPAATPKGGE